MLFLSIIARVAQLVEQSTYTRSVGGSSPSARTNKMAKIYVAGNEIERAGLVMDGLRSRGHTITFDWIPGIKEQTDENKIERALLEREGIREADILVYLWKENQESARFEAGMAMGLKKPIIVSSDHKAFFFSLPEIVQVSSDDEIVEAIKRLDL